MLELWIGLYLAVTGPKYDLPTQHATARTQIAYIAAPHYGPKEWACLDRLIWRESRWNPRADNPASTAFGLFQLLRLPENLSIHEQWERGRKYIDHRYSGSPCKSLDSSRQRGWY